MKLGIGWTQTETVERRVEKSAKSSLVAAKNAPKLWQAYVPGTFQNLPLRTQLMKNQQISTRKAKH